MSDETQTGAHSAADLKAMFTELLDGAKRDIFAQVKDSIDHVYAVLKVWMTPLLRLFNSRQSIIQHTA